ncbi:MAG: hypothetical protein IJ783_10635 [Kiritimatiellae bacterium]|nr:hypothetical protein [Kiritimatiellia bacterium]
MKLFLLRWNPDISSWKDSDFRKALADSRKGFVAMDWSVRDREKLEAWDWAVLCRVGTDADGIVAIGRFDGRVEEADSWRKDGSKCHYAFFWMSVVQDPARTGLLRAEALVRAVPGVDWHGGHSGVVVPPESAPALARAIADALEAGPAGPGAGFFGCFPDGPGELARSLRLDFCPESFLDVFRRNLPGLEITFHREGDPDGESPDCGDIRILVANPHGGCPLRIDLGGDPTVFFGGWHAHFFDHDDEWNVLVEDAKKIVAGSMRAYAISSNGRWYGSRSAERRFDGSFVRSKAEAFRFIVDFYDRGTGAFLRQFARKGAKLEWTAWNPEENGSVELEPDWFATVARPTGLDAVLASHEAQWRNGNGLLDSFEFSFRGTSFECRRTGRKWTIVRKRLFRSEPDAKPIVAGSFATLLDATLPRCRKTTVRDALTRSHAFDVEIFWRDPKSSTQSRSLSRLRCNFFRKAATARNLVEVPVDDRGLYGLEYESAATPAHFLSVRLTDAAIRSLFPAFVEMNAKFGIRIDQSEEEILPSRFAADARALLRTFRDRAADPVARKAAEKVLPVFEQAAKLRMPVAFWF